MGDKPRESHPSPPAWTPLVVGLTGPNAAGKGEAARFFARRGLAYHSLSDIVREEALRRGLTTGRDHLISVGNLLRREGGAGALARKTLPRLTGWDVVDSIRNPGEVEVLRGSTGFVLLGITAPPEVRFRRATGRKGRGDALESLEAFIAKEDEENTSEETAQRLQATFGLCDFVVVNDGGLKAFRAKLENWFQSLCPSPFL